MIVGVDFFFFKQKTAYEMRISDWSSDVCSSDLFLFFGPFQGRTLPVNGHADDDLAPDGDLALLDIARLRRSAFGAAVRGRRGRRRAHSDQGKKEHTQESPAVPEPDRKSVVEGKSVSVRVDSDGSSII